MTRKKFRISADLYAELIWSTLDIVDETLEITDLNDGYIVNIVSDITRDMDADSLATFMGILAMSVQNVIHHINEITSHPFSRPATNYSLSLPMIFLNINSIQFLPDVSQNKDTSCENKNNTFIELCKTMREIKNHKNTMSTKGYKRMIHPVQKQLTKFITKDLLRIHQSLLNISDILKLEYSFACEMKIGDYKLMKRRINLKKDGKSKRLIIEKVPKKEENKK